ncbi:phage tail tip fiber protein [Leisingera caerulea]|uniref:phage tail tip fiber protein n=1 Tax=Leisingera caerulea TaxID=506591 RepID=UPI0004174B8C|nr:DUF1983 domain-containing protein [Leisingera caerulea]
MKLLFASLLALLALTQPADAASIGAALVALGTAFKAYVAANAIAGFALRTLISAGVSQLVKKFKQRKQRKPGLQTTATTSGGTDPQGTVLGRHATAGHLVYQNSYLENNCYLVHIIEVSDLPGVKLRRLIVDGEYTDIAEEADQFGNSQLLGKKDAAGVPFGWIHYYDGTQTAADPYIVSELQDKEDRPWTENHILTGICYAIVIFKRNDGVYPNGRPQVRFELGSPPLYDPRQDTTAGGSGTHRWNDPSTWSETENLMVIAYNVMRGITLPCGSVWGGGFPAEDLPYQEWAAAMDACDLGVGGNSRPQFRGGMEIRFEEAPADFLEEVFASANADILELGGYWYPLVGSENTIAADLTEGDLLVSEGWKHDPFPGLETAYNAVTVTHTSPNALWNPAAPITLTKPEWEAEDGGQRMFSLKLPMVFNAQQARQLGNALLKENRRFRTHRLPLPPEFARLRPLLKVRFTSDWYGYGAKAFTITEMAYDLLTLNVSVSLREWDHSDYDPDLALEIPEAPQVTTPIIVEDAGVPGFGVSGVEIKDADGVVRGVAIRAVWDPDLAYSAEGISFQVRVKNGDDERFSASASDLKLGTFRLEPMQGATDYEARAKAISRSRKTNWTGWLPVTTPEFRLQPDVLDETVWQAVSDDAASIAAGLDDQLVLDRIDPLESAVQRELQIRDVQSFHAAEALGLIGDQVLWALTKVSEIDGRMADAGIFKDPETGTVRIYGIEAEAERISEAEIRLSAAEASISLSATQAWVNQQISNAVLDPSQIPVVDDLQVRVNQVEADLDAAEAAITLKASQTELDGMETRLTSAEVDIDAAGAAIGLKVDQAKFDAAESRLSTAEFQISTLEGPSITQTVSDVRTIHEQLAAQDVATLEQLLLAYDQREALKTQIAYATQDIRARVDDERAATAAITAALGVAIENSVALVEAEKLVRASGDNALASTIDALEVRLDGDIAAQSTALSALTTRVTDAEGTITSQSQSLTSLDSRLTTAEGSISGNATAVSQLDTRVADAEGDISSQATAITTLQSNVGSNSASIQQTMQAVNGVMGEYTLRIDNNGHVSGMVVRSELDDQGQPASEVAFQSDKFAIVSADGSQKRSPFVVYTEDTTIGGVLVPAGVYMRKAAIRNGSIGNAEIAGSLQSDNYAEDADGIPTEGVKIDFRNDVVKLAGPVISRNIEAAAGSFWTGGPITVDPNSGLYQVETWELVETGLQVPVDQVWMASNKTYLAYAAFDGSATAPGGISGNSEYWGCKAEVLPFARWNGPQQLYLRIELWAKGISALHRSGNATLGGKIHWKLYEVT